MSKTFYSVLSQKPELKEALSKLGFSEEDLKARLEAISEIETGRASYIFEKGTSQNASIIKKKTLNTLSKWMTLFFQSPETPSKTSLSSWKPLV